MGHEQLRALVRASEKLGPDQRGIALVTSDLLEDVLEDLDKAEAKYGFAIEERDEARAAIPNLDRRVGEVIGERDTAREACADLRKRVIEVANANADLRCDRTRLELENASLRKRVAELEAWCDAQRDRLAATAPEVTPDHSIRVRVCDDGSVLIHRNGSLPSISLTHSASLFLASAITRRALQDLERAETST